MSVAEAQEKVDAREFASWMAYNRVSPFGDERADLRSAVIASVVANANRGKGTKPFTIDDFLPTFERRPQGQTADEMLSRLALFAEAHNRKAKG